MANKVPKPSRERGLLRRRGACPRLGTCRVSAVRAAGDPGCHRDGGWRSGGAGGQIRRPALRTPSTILSASARSLNGNRSI
jgi:hypothetical protein